MMSKKEDGQIIQAYRVRRARQSFAIWTALILVFLLALIYKRPIAQFEFSRNTIFGAQCIVIAAFIGFTSINWRCPSCDKYLGNDIGRLRCGKCGRRLS